MFINIVNVNNSTHIIEEEYVKYLPTKVTWTPYQLYAEFPQSKPAALRAIKELRRQVFTLQDIGRSKYELVNKILLDEPIARLMVRIDYLKKFIDLCTYKKGDNGEVYAQRVLRAKAVPATNFIEFDRSGFAECVWHNEKSGSMKYYPKENKVTCFGCNKSGDVIDILMTIKNLSFLQAVNQLA